MGTWTAGVKPTTPSSQLSDQMQRVQASVVQHHYVRAELHDINTRKGAKLIEETIAALKLTPQGKKANKAQLMDGFNHMTKRLQTAELTINFKSTSWFMSPNNYDSYTQMYERAVRAIGAPGQPAVKEMRLKSDPLNPAQLRVATDDKVTFRKDVLANDKFDPQYGGMGRVMSPGGLRTPTVDAKPGEFEAVNPFFNPKSKQVFAALNYGRRPHGSAVTYGSSYMVLNPRFKTNAIFFAGDTFGITAGMKVAADDQISYDLLGAVYGKANDRLKTDLYKSCILDASLGESTSSLDVLLLVEAHIFEPLTFSGNLEVLYVSGSDMLSGKKITGAEWQTIQTNARAFANKHGAKVVFIE